uniref:Uncharacterized protein n=1 Tax=Oncorhynchus mykiss TaxID=8022 RepID=A0A8C7RDC7_ONCMY
MPHPHNGEVGPRTGEGEGEHLSESHGPPQGDSLPPPSPLMNPSLQEVIGLLRAEFAFNGYLENGVEDLAMGEYFLSLKDLQYQTFCNVVKEKFCDLYWDEDLLGVLHCVVNYKPLKFSAHTDVCMNTHTNTHTDYLTHPFSLSSCSAMFPGPGLRAAECLVKGAMESAEHPVGGGDESPSEADSLWGTDEPLSVGPRGQMSPDCCEDMEDTEFLVSQCLLSTSSGAEESSHSYSPAWALAFYGGDCFSQDVVEYARNLGQHSESPCLELKTQELQQQLMIETKSLKKTRHFYQKLLHQERKNKRSDARLMLSKLKVQLEELRSKVEFLDSIKKYLEVLSVDQWGVDVSLLPSLAASDPGSPLDLQPSEEPAVLELVSLSGAGTGKSSLQAATPLDFMSYLYARNAPLEGYIQQFLYTYRYFCTPQELLQFLMGKFTSVAAGYVGYYRDSAKVYHRSLDVLQTWLTDYIMVDFSPKSSLLMTLENFLTTEVITELINHQLITKKLKTVDVSLHPFSQSEHSAQHTAQQLTLLQQEMFQGCHPIHFLNSKFQGVRDKAVCVTKHASHSVPPVEGSSLFVHEGTPQDSHLQQLLRYADSVSNWVSADLVICDSIKIQAALLTKFLLIAKHCYESRDFATAMQVLGGLENVIVRQLPAWKHLSTKVCEVLEDLRAVQVFLKSDNLCLMGGEHVRRRPTLPAVHILAMHIQQLEIGAFTLTSGAYKWPKLRTIAKVVSQVHAFQETVYSFTPDPGLQAYIRLRIAHLSGCDIPLLAADNEANFHHNPTDRHTRRIQDTLKRVKATFQ